MTDKQAARLLYRLGYGEDKAPIPEDKSPLDLLVDLGVVEPPPAPAKKKRASKKKVK